MAPAPADDLTVLEVVELLDLAPLPGEGGWFRETLRDAASTAIWFLVAPGAFSAMHRLAGPELWHAYAGAPASMLLLRPGGAVDEPLLGPDLRAGQRPQLLVEAGTWMGASSTGAWSLLGTTMAPPFDPAEVELGDPAALTAGWPTAADRIATLTR